MKVSFALTIVMALVIHTGAHPMIKEEEEDGHDYGMHLGAEEQQAMLEAYKHFNWNDMQDAPPCFRGINRFFSHYKKPRLQTTCQRNPKICQAKGSPGTNCCKNKCVNILADRYNCGRCGVQCKYSEICCEGRCVNPSFNQRHCGACNNRCNTGSYCSFGLCNYS